jgi:hypothetical protein
MACWVLKRELAGDLCCKRASVTTGPAILFPKDSWYRIYRMSQMIPFPRNNRAPQAEFYHTGGRDVKLSALYGFNKSRCFQDVCSVQNGFAIL